MTISSEQSPYCLKAMMLVNQRSFPRTVEFSLIFDPKLSRHMGPPYTPLMAASKKISDLYSRRGHSFADTDLIL
jgi:hypothetical protein